MGKAKIVITAIVVVVVSVVAYQSISSDPGENLEIIADENEVVRSPENRTWNNDIIGDEIDLHSDIRDSVLRAQNFEMIDGSIFVGDFSNMRIMRFDLDGRYIRSYGGGSGPGPGEFTLIIDLAGFGSDTLLALDSRKREMMGFSLSSGNLLFTRTVKYEPYRMVAVEDSLVVHASLSAELFRRYTPDLEVQSEFGSIVRDQLQNAISLTGELVSVGDGEHFIYTPTRTSYLFYFDLSGNEIRRIIAPDRIAIKAPETRVSEDVKVTSPHLSRVRVYDLDIINNKLFVTSLKRNKNNALEYSLIDIYEVSSGKYVESIRMPTIGDNIIVSENRIYYTEFETETVKAYQFSM